MKKINKTIISASLIGMFVLVVFITSGFSEENRKVCLATSNWEPYYGDALPGNGFYAEITRAAFQRVGIEFIVEFHPWNRALEMSKRGKFDGLLGAYYNEERSRYFTYTDSVYESQEVFFCKKDAQISYASLNDLSKYMIGVVRGWGSIEILKKANLNLDEVTDHDMNIKKLMAGRIDLICTEKIALLNLIQTKYPQWKDAIKIVPRPLVTLKIFNPISNKIPNHEKIVKDFNRGLKMIKDDGTFEKILTKHGFGEAE